MTNPSDTGHTNDEQPPERVPSTAAGEGVRGGPSDPSGSSRQDEDDTRVYAAPPVNNQLKSLTMSYGVMTKMERSTNSSRAMSWFKTADTDGNSAISFSEFESMLKKMNYKLSHEEACKHFNDFCENAALGLTLNRFTDWWMDNAAILLEKGSATMESSAMAGQPSPSKRRTFRLARISLKMRGENLPASDLKMGNADSKWKLFHRGSDPYFKVLVRLPCPDGPAEYAEIFSSNVVQDNLNPDFEEIVFCIDDSADTAGSDRNAGGASLQAVDIKIEVWDSDRYASNDFLGCVYTSLRMLETPGCTLPLQKRNGNPSRGMLIVETCKVNVHTRIEGDQPVRR